MGKKGKKATKQTTGGGGGGDGGDKKKVGPGKARRERAATIRDLEARIAALAEKLDVELEGVDVFSPLEEREDCPVCFVTLPLASDDLEFNACCGQVVCKACSFLQSVHELKNMATIDDHSMKILENSPCAFCRSDRWQNFSDKCERLADKGNAEAMVALAHEYLSGHHVTKDELSALGWCVRAAEAGDPTALVDVANVYCQSNIVERNKDRAKHLAVAAAKKGCSKAHVLLAAIYFADFEVDLYGGGGTQTKFLDHWKFAAAGGCRKSMENIEYARGKYGLITEEDVDRVRGEFEMAAKVEWTEERDEWRRDEFMGRIGRILEQKKRQQEIERGG